MKTMKVSETTNTQLDWLVAKCEGLILHKDAMLSGIVMEGWYASGHYMDPNQWIRLGKLRYSSDWSQMGPIIERERIIYGFHDSHPFGPDDLVHACLQRAKLKPGQGRACWYAPAGGATILQAAARCYVASKLGETVEIPDEL